MDAADYASRIEALTELVQGAGICVLTGAGCSTESGIPDYRGPETRRRARNPIRMNAFLRDPATRRRYWARSFVGWPRMMQAAPNAAHLALAQLESSGHVRGIITQNVDGLHARAHSQQVVELHGALRDVVCLDCDARHARSELQARLEADNPHFHAALGEQAPDGDADVSDAWLAEFVPPRCGHCAEGVLKPDVVFFGESVPRARVELAFAMLDQARALLVVGSSLAVFSGLRFVRRAHLERKPVAFVNLGETRADALAMLRVEASAGRVLSDVAARLR